MKKALGLCFFVIVYVSSQANCYSDGINVLSSEYHVWGNVAGVIWEVIDNQYVNQQDIYEQYDEISFSPISRSVDLADFGFGCSVGLAYASSTADSSTLDVFAGSGQGSCYIDSKEYFFSPDHPGNDAFAEASWTFMTVGNNLSIVLDQEQGTYSDLEVWLHDLTTGTELFHANGYVPYGLSGHLLGEEFNEVNSHHYISIPVDTTHEYSIILYVLAESQNDTDYAHISAELSSVLEPPACFHLNRMIVKDKIGSTKSDKTELVGTIDFGPGIDPFEAPPAVTASVAYGSNPPETIAVTFPEESFEETDYPGTYISLINIDGGGTAIMEVNFDECFWKIKIRGIEASGFYDSEERPIIEVDFGGAVDTDSFLEWTKLKVRGEARTAEFKADLKVKCCAE